MATYHGIVNADVAVAAASAVGLPAFVAFALLDMESEGKNIFGSDSGGMYKGEEVTQAKFEAMEEAVANGHPSNGVGPCQITHRSFFPQARAQGLKLWEPYDNMIYGFGMLAGYLKRYPGDYQKAGRLYNGKDSYGNTFLRVVGEWKARWDSAPYEEENMAAWHLAPSLKKLQGELDDVFGENRPNDGTIGDEAHAARDSEHNPDNDPDSMPKGAVSAIDIYTYAKSKTWIKAAEFENLLAKFKKDPRVWYVIHKGYIYSRTYDFAKRKYTGSNPHTNHIHISLVQTKAAHDNVSSWGLDSIKGGSEAPAPKPTEPKLKKLPTLTIGDRDEVLVPFLKRFFGMRDNSADGVVGDDKFGRGLLSKVRWYQGQQKLSVDGYVGPKTWGAIASGGTILPSGYEKP